MWTLQAPDDSDLQKADEVWYLFLRRCYELKSEASLMIYHLQLYH
jgi:hypothetical protein